MSLFRPKSRVNAKLAHLVNQHDEIVAQHLGERFVDLGRVGLTAERVAKLTLDHAERRFDVAPLAVVGQELVAAVHEVPVGLCPRAAAPAARSVRAGARARGLEGDERRATDASDGFGVADAAVGLVSRHVSDGEGTRGRFDKRGQVRRVMGITPMNLNSGDDVRLDAAHDVRLDPRVLTARRAVLVIEPQFKSAGCKARRAYGEINLNGLERRAALGDQRAGWASVRHSQGR